MRHNSDIPCKTKQTVHLPLDWKEKTQTEEAKISVEHLWRLFLYLLCLSVKQKRKVKFCGLRKIILREEDREKKSYTVRTTYCVMFNIPNK